ncbi:MAG TPA: RNA polymerase sigma factor [Solirubrobacteraceae bacterium]|jgi:RNA polymerase sigma factor (sigma-70 family)
MEASAPPRPARAPLRSPDRLRTSGDAELVRLVRLGHEPAFEQIYDRHHRGILSFCRHMLGSRDEAEDAVQHTFIAAYRDLRGSDKPIHLKAWLYTIARNRCLSMLRARREQVSLEDVEPATDGLAAEVQRRQDLKDMLRDLHRLPHDQRAALVLSELGALSHEEIAMTLDVRKEKVKALVFQARESLSNSRQARNADCREIQKQLSVLRGGSLRRTTLRRHVEQCDACRSFKEEVQRQRQALAIILPVAPSAGLKSAVLGGASAAGAAAGGGAIAGAGGGIGAKLLIGAVLAGAGLGGGLMAIDELSSPPSSSAEEAQRRQHAELRLAGTGGYQRSDDAGRPAEGEVAGAVDRLRARAQTVAGQRDTDRRIALGQPVWGTAIPGARTGPDPAQTVAIVTIVTEALDDIGGGRPGKKPKKAKKPKHHQHLGAQGKGRGYGRGREPAASAGNRRGGGSAGASAGGGGGRRGNGQGSGHAQGGGAKSHAGSGGRGHRGGGSSGAGAAPKQRAPSGSKGKVKSNATHGNQAPPSAGPKAEKGPAPGASGPPPKADDRGGNGGERSAGTPADAVGKSANDAIQGVKDAIGGATGPGQDKKRSVAGALLGLV